LLAAKRVRPLDPTIITGVAAASVDVEAQRVHLADGRELPYDALVVATGVYPRTLPFPDGANVHVIRTMEHSLALQAQLGEGVRLIVFGGGFLGLEAAATARGLGADVHVVEPIPGPPLANKIGTVAAAKLLAMHTDHGVTIQTGIGVEGIEADGVKLSDGSRLDGDVMLISIGAAPMVSWLEGSGLPLDNGLVCDEYCYAGNNVWGAGDVASWVHVGYGRRLRLEHRTNAQEQGQHVAANILGAHEPFTPIPYFWTDQFESRVQVRGLIPPEAEGEIVEGDPDGDSFVQTFSVQGRPIGVLGWNAARLAMQHARQLSAG
jgi:NADPH-dependent 2,4-dienoyl-CoA reductase/sulfur reductase-like enzyme